MCLICIWLKVKTIGGVEKESRIFGEDLDYEHNTALTLTLYKCVKCGEEKAVLSKPREVLDSSYDVERAKQIMGIQNE